MNPRTMIIAAFAVTLGIICYSDIRTCREPPWPPRIIGVGIVFGMLDLLSMASEELASVMAAGVVLAALVSSGFKPVCGPHSCATSQPQSYNALQGPTYLSTGAGTNQPGYSPSQQRLNQYG